MVISGLYFIKSIKAIKFIFSLVKILIKNNRNWQTEKDVKKEFRKIENYVTKIKVGNFKSNQLNFLISSIDFI
jgi:hypothetical protein